MDKLDGCPAARSGGPPTALIIRQQVGITVPLLSRASSLPHRER
ncbi:hypothetical protein SUDANB96_00302 [Streptomyces sp. enrichment culture]